MANLYKQLVDLLPGSPLLVGTVSVVGNGVVTVTLPGGGSQTARGSATVGQQVFIQDGAVQGVAPSLPIVLADV